MLPLLSDSQDLYSDVDIQLSHYNPRLPLRGYYDRNKVLNG